MERPDEEFLQEARSNLRGLTDGLLSVEGRHDPETIDELFRTAHSLKGACRTVGLADASQLAHALEDVLDALRRGDAAATAELIDEALAAVDDLEATVEAFATGREPAVDPVAAGADLRDALDAHRTGTATGTGTGTGIGSTLEDGPTGGSEDAPSSGVDEDGLSEDVVAALDEASEFDDIDALVAEMDDPDDDDASLEAWGVLDGTGTVGASDDAAAEPDSGGTPDDPSAFFESVKGDVAGEPADTEDLQRDIEAVEFGEFDEDDDVTIDELIDLEPTAEPLEGDSPEPTDADRREPDAEPADEATGPADERADGPAGDATGVGPDDAGSPEFGTASGDLGEEGTPTPSGAAGPAEADPATAPTASDTVADDPGTAEPTTGEPRTDEPSVDEPGTDEPSVDEPGTDEPQVGEPAADAGEAAESAEHGGFEFGTVRTGDATDEAESPGRADAASAPGDPSDRPASASASTDAVPASGADATTDPGDEVPDPDSLPDLDLDVDVTGEPVAAGASAQSEIDVELDEEMIAFESRFEGQLDPSAGETEPEEESDVFRAAVTTIGESSLDGDRYGAADGPGDADASASGRLPPMTVSVETAERLMTIAEELSLARHQMEAALGEEVPELRRLVAEYRHTVTDVRLMPLETAIEGIPRTVRDVARSQDKEVDLVVEDADVGLDRGVIDRLRDPLVHLARNAVDHGIEPPAERVAAGKPPEGRIELRTEQVGDEVVIELSDDGRGIDPDRVRESAVEAGRLSPEAAEELTDEETYDLLFEAGVSTAEEVTDVSGRGVGMDVVGHRIAALDGSVEVESERGRGTTVRLIVPVSIALTEVVFVETGDEQFGLPLAVVEGITEAPGEPEHGDDVRLEEVPSTVTPREIDPRDEVPFVRLREALDVAGRPAPDRTRVVWVRAGVDLLAVGCDRIVGSREVIVRPYEDLLGDVPGVQGATTRSDGRPVNVIDVGSL